MLCMTLASSHWCTSAVLLLAMSSCQSETPAVLESPSVAGQQSGILQAFAQTKGRASFVYILEGGKARRLTHGENVWESSPVLSRDGRLVAYSCGSTQEGRSDVLVAHIDGSSVHRVSTADQDALMPAFDADGRSVFYVISRSFGHSSPIAASRRHDFDVMKVAIDPDQTIAGTVPVELTQSYFRDVQSLSVSPDGEQFLLSTTGYPIGGLLLEFWVEHPLRQHRVFQPHVPGESSTGPSFGQAMYVGDGMKIVFAAASEPATGGNYDYNVYQISEVTGSDLISLTHHKGMIDSLSVSLPKSVGFVDADGYSQVTLPAPQILRHLALSGRL